MGTEFGQLLRELRVKAHLKQDQLGRRVHYGDGSMISRFESGTVPDPLKIQEIIEALSAQGIARDELDQLRRAAGYGGADIFETKVIDPIIVSIQHELENLDSSEDQDLLRDDLRSVIELDQGLFFARKVGKQKRWKQAADELLKLRDLQEERFQRWYLRVDKDLGRYFYNDAKLTEAVQHYGSAHWSAKRLEDLREQGEILIDLGDAYRRRGGNDWREAHDCYNHALEIFSGLGDRRLVADCLRRDAGAHLFEGRPDKAEPLCEESLKISREEHYDEGVYKGLQHLAWVYSMRGRWDEATHLCEEALSLVSDDWDRIRALRYAGDAYRLARQINRAEKAYREALNILERFHSKGVRHGIVYGLIQLGLGKLYLKQPGRELEVKHCLNEGLKVHGSLGEDWRSSEFLSEQGNLLLRLGRLKEAEMRLQLASDRFKTLGNIFHYANTLALLCELHYKEGTKGFDRIRDLAETAQHVDNGLINYHLARIEFIVGKTQIDLKQFSAAATTFGKASEKALMFNTQSFQEIFNELLLEVDRVAQSIAPQAAMKICEAYEAVWGGIMPSLTQKQVVQESLNAIRQRRMTFMELAPIY